MQTPLISIYIILCDSVPAPSPRRGTSSSSPRPSRIFPARRETFPDRYLTSRRFSPKLYQRMFSFKRIGSRTSQSDVFVRCPFFVGLVLAASPPKRANRGFVRFASIPRGVGVPQWRNIAEEFNANDAIYAISTFSAFVRRPTDRNV